MADIVLDSSFLIAVLVEEDHSDFSRTTLKAFEGRTLRAPALIAWEVTNTLQVKVRRKLLTPDERSASLANLGLLGVEAEPPPDATVLARIASACDRTGLTAYDAAYLELALELGAELATLDRRLAEIGRAEGLTIHAPFR